jgi:hypothetical protein
VRRRGRGIEILGHHVDPRDRACRRHGVKLCLKPPFALQGRRHVLTALPRQHIRVLFQSRGGFGSAESLLRGFDLKLSDDALQLIQRSADPLPVLLSELGALGADDSGDQGDGKEYSSGKQRSLISAGPVSRYEG